MSHGGGGASDQTPTARVLAAYRRIGEVNRPEVWITLRDRDAVLAEAAVVEDRLAAGDKLPLAGLVVAVKDNTDVAGLPTTAACPQFAYTAHTTAAAVDRLTAAGAVVLGKTNLDQFATGFTGTRSPYGAVRNAHRPELISGGSSSGSAVAVALGIADIGIGTDTLGSGRVPAACNGVVGIKLSSGIIPTHGVVPACADLDTVTVFADHVGLGARTAAVMAGPDPRDPRSRPWPTDVALAAPATPNIAVADDATLGGLHAEYRDAFAQTVAEAESAGCTVERIDVSELLDAAGRIDDTAMIAERHAAVGEFLATEPADADPTVAATIGAARAITGAGFAAGLHALAHAQAAAAELLARFDALVLPTAPKPPTQSQVRADPISTDRPMGTYTSFCNLFDLPAIAIPGAPTTSGAPFGAMVVTSTHAEQVGIDIAARLAGEAPLLVVDHGVDLAVFGAQHRAQIVRRWLEELRARDLGPVRAGENYRYTTPDNLGHGNLYRISKAALGCFVAALTIPRAMMDVELSDGHHVFGCIVTDDNPAHPG